MRGKNQKTWRGSLKMVGLIMKSGEWIKIKKGIVSQRTQYKTVVKIKGCTSNIPNNYWVENEIYCG